MHYDSNRPRLLTSLRHWAGRTWLMAITLMTFSVAGFAQETTSGVRGTVSGPDGSPVAGATVTVTDTRTGTVRSATTNDSGSFNIRSLAVGGPYTIRVQSSQYQGALVTDVFTDLSGAANFDIDLAEAQAIDEVTVTAAQVATAKMALGPGTAFSAADIASMPSIQRQIRDIIRIDPRVSIARADNGGGSGINCLGGSSRSNAFTIDGAVANDGFGLNEGTGTSARFAFPVPFDTVESASVEFAPLDVQYSQFTGCAINIVTKGGSNEFHGSAFYMWNDDSLSGDTLDGEQVIFDPFELEDFGFNLSGPIIKDKLFFSLAYEETDEPGVQNTGPIGAGFANEDFLTLDQANQIRDVLISDYGRDPGTLVRTLPQTSERIFARIDWNINEQHRAEFTYSSLEEENIGPDDLGFNGFTFSDNFEIEGLEQETFSMRVFSDWTENFSTEFRYSTFDVTDIQGPVGGGEAQNDDKPRIIVEADGDDIFTSGPGFFRSSNDLSYTVDQIKLAADYIIGDHTLTFGIEQETRDIFNLFIPNATGTITFVGDDFDEALAALQAGTADSIDMLGSFTQDPTDASASFERDITSFYIQDEWQLNQDLTLIAGVRYDEYSSDDLPIFNTRFEERYGFSNQQTFDGLDLVQPRLGLRWEMPSTSLGETQLNLGFGVFGGGDPTVHFANSYQNFGGAIGFGASFFGECAGQDPNQVLVGGTFTGLPDCVRQAAANSALANNGAVAAVDPDFDLPANQRWSIGISHLMSSDIGFIDGWSINADYIYTDHKNAVNFVDVRLSPNGVTLPDGRPQFFEVDPTQAGCNATFNGIGQGFSNAGTNGGPCDDTDNSNQDIVMTNGPEGSTASLSLQLNKDFQFSDRTSLGVGLGYAWLDAEVGNPLNSSTAGSNYEEVAVAVLNDVQLGPALWANEHNFVIRLNFEHYFFENHPTQIGVFWNRRSGRPFSYTYEDDTVEQYFGDSDDEERVLASIPTGPNDPAYDFTGIGAEETAAFFAYLEAAGLTRYAGRVTPKNGFNAPYFSDMDIRISQDVPLPWSDHSLNVFMNIENFLNLLSDGGNIRRFADVGDIQEGIRLLEVLGDTANTDQFVVSDWYDEGLNWDRDVDDSIYKIQIGVRYQF